VEKLTYVFDIDGTICSDENGKYDRCTPIRERINFINQLYLNGNTVIFMTARGMDSCNGNQSDAIKKYLKYTEKQLKSWGCLYSRLYLGKPKADHYIDDKGVKDTDFFASIC